MSGPSFIKPMHVVDFQTVTSPHLRRNIRLASCKLNGEPTVAIVRLAYVSGGAVTYEALFVWPTDGMVIEVQGRRYGRRSRSAVRPKQKQPPSAAAAGPQVV